MDSLPTLSLWHTTVLKNEFSKHQRVKTFEEYKALEEKLFAELETKIYDKIPTNKQNSINRYTKNSLADPRRWKPNWNKSFELPVANPKGAVLLLHGMSDVPYSLHNQAQYLHEHGYWVLSLRMPGHGTIPSGLRAMKWQDMAAVVELGMNHLIQKVGNKSIDIMGYSTGAPLALNYTLKALKEKSTLKVPDKLVFYSPAIGVSAAAPFAVWQSRVGYVLGLPKLEWNALNSKSMTHSNTAHLLSMQVIRFTVWQKRYKNSLIHSKCTQAKNLSLYTKFSVYRGQYSFSICCDR
ncbi:MAG: alpha/beta fold hydrolase [Epsilonproteobacteria bacterium]|nr:alpha/beta fold hydrolase [Campylobacterota bacterium]